MLIIDLVLSLLILVMLAYLVRHYAFTLIAVFYRRGQRHFISHVADYYPKVSILLPARNEEQVIERLLQRMVELTYPKENLEVIAIDDGSTDQTGLIMDRFAKIYRYIKVVRRIEGPHGKSRALNDGLKQATGEVVLCFDADYFPQRDIVEKLAVYFADPEVGAVQGRVTVLNEQDSLVSKIVTLERIGGYRVDQVARDDLRLIPQFGGTVGGFRRSLIQSLGGWNPNILAEDTDLTFKVYLAGYKVRYVNDAECYEEAVRDWSSYWKQRYRWARGHMQCAFSHLVSLIKSRRIGFWEKVDGTLLLNIYFVPVLIGLAWGAGVLAYFIEPPWWTPYFWGSVFMFSYSSVGNFAPFFEIGMGAYLDKRNRIYWLIPALLIAFVLNVFICTKAFIDLALSCLRGDRYSWVKTVHNGNGNHYLNKNGKRNGSGQLC